MSEAINGRDLSDPLLPGELADADPTYTDEFCAWFDMDRSVISAVIPLPDLLKRDEYDHNRPYRIATSTGRIFDAQFGDPLAGYLGRTQFSYNSMRHLLAATVAMDEQKMQQRPDIAPWATVMETEIQRDRDVLSQDSDAFLYLLYQERSASDPLRSPVLASVMGRFDLERMDQDLNCIPEIEVVSVRQDQSTDGYLMRAEFGVSPMSRLYQIEIANKSFSNHDLTVFISNSGDISSISTANVLTAAYDLPDAVR